jgi:hypothetical protein
MADAVGNAVCRPITLKYCLRPRARRIGINITVVSHQYEYDNDSEH